MSTSPRSNSSDAALADAWGAWRLKRTWEPLAAEEPKSICFCRVFCALTGSPQHGVARYCGPSYSRSNATEQGMQCYGSSGGPFGV